jgi:N-acetylglucosaminyldiphosphoundecaprenol N-acetyl-beta-D-mannosaminyltransferase
MQNIAQNDIVSICGIQITNLSFFDCLARISQCFGKPAQTFIVTPNVDHIIKLQKDAEFREVYKHADLVLADGCLCSGRPDFFGHPLGKRSSIIC